MKCVYCLCLCFNSSKYVSRRTMFKHELDRCKTTILLAWFKEWYYVNINNRRLCMSNNLIYYVLCKIKCSSNECKVQLLLTTGWNAGCSHPTWGKRIIAGKKHKHRFVLPGWVLSPNRSREALSARHQRSPDFPAASPVSRVNSNTARGWWTTETSTVVL